MKVLICWFIVFSFLGCKKEQKAPPTNTPTNTPTTTSNAVSTSFTSYVNRFISLASTRGYSLSSSSLVISYDSSLSGTNTLGYCTTGGANPIIGINRTYWESWASQGRSYEMEQLMFHELGHCLLSRSHDNNTINASNDSSSSIPVSIMNAYHISPTYYNVNYTYYINELFDNSLSGTLALYSTGTSNFPNGVYASKIQNYAMKATSKNYVDEELSYTIDEFRCDDFIQQQ